MRIAVITGASSGMGKQFALKLKDNFSVDEVWLIARNRDRLSETCEGLFNGSRRHQRVFRVYKRA